MNPTFVCLAFKLNDIFYAKQSIEFKNSRTRILLNFNQPQYSIDSEFSRIYNFKYERSIKSITRIAHKIYRINKELEKYGHTTDYISTSNVQLLIVQIISQFILKKSKIIFLEDGLMNYRHDGLFMPNNFTQKIPPLIQKLTNLENTNIIKKISNSYFLLPSLAKARIRNKNQLKITPPPIILDSIIQKLEGKTIFIGQPLYGENPALQKLYTSTINNLASEGLIEIYIPHKNHNEIFEDYKVPVFNISDQLITLEVLASKLDTTKILSFSSSSLYTLPAINPKIKAILLYHEAFNNNDLVKLIATLNPSLQVLTTNTATP